MMAVAFVLPTWVFWASLILLAYTYAAYPALCWLRSRVQPHPWQISSEYRPFVSIVVAAYNEEQNIGARIRDIAQQRAEFPFELLIGSDGSSDQTIEVARAVASEVKPDLDVRIYSFPRAGKIATLAALVREARGEVIVFTDANCRFAPGALSNVVAPLADSAIGCADGVKRVDSGNIETTAGEQSYWSFETNLKRWESAFGSSAGADGALYAVRKEDLPTFKTDRMLADDFYISLAPCRRGRRCILVPNAIALEPSDTTHRKELKRKARILAGALGVIAQYPQLLLPGSGVSLTLWSHKIFRWFSFVPLFAMMVGGFALPASQANAFYGLVIGAAIAVMIGAAFPGALRLTPVKLMYYFAVMNCGQVLGVVEWMRNSNQPAWEKVR